MNLKMLMGNYQVAYNNQQAFKERVRRREEARKLREEIREMKEVEDMILCEKERNDAQWAVINNRRHRRLSNRQAVPYL